MSCIFRYQLTDWVHECEETAIETLLCAPSGVCKWAVSEEEQVTEGQVYYNGVRAMFYLTQYYKTLHWILLQRLFAKAL